MKIKVEIEKFSKRVAIDLQFKAVYVIGVIWLHYPPENELLAIQVEGVGLLRKLGKCDTFPMLFNLSVDFQEGVEAAPVVLSNDWTENAFYEYVEGDAICHFSSVL